MTAFLNHGPACQTVEIGITYYVPGVRGSGLNRCAKHLLLNRAFACGIRRVEFRVDDRNARSKAAMRKLGANQDGLIRAERITWTGHVRDTALFSMLAGEWRNLSTVGSDQTD
jgi:RimJ/RimL family protein N-acetyltransferase